MASAPAWDVNPTQGVGGVPYPTGNDQSLYPMDSRPVFGSAQPQQHHNYTANYAASLQTQPGFTAQDFPPQPGFAPRQMQGYQARPGYPPPTSRYPCSGAGFPRPQGYSIHTGGYPQPLGYSPQTHGYPQPQGYHPQGVGGYPQPQGYPQPGLYSGSSGNTDMAMAAGLGALAGLAGTYFADKTPTMGEMAVGAGVGGAVGLAGSAATSDGAMSALGLAGHDMGDMKTRRNARRAARYGIPIAAMGAGFLTNKAFDRGSGYDSE